MNLKKNHPLGTCAMVVPCEEHPNVGKVKFFVQQKSHYIPCYKTTLSTEHSERVNAATIVYRVFFVT